MAIDSCRVSHTCKGETRGASNVLHTILVSGDREVSHRVIPCSPWTQLECPSQLLGTTRTSTPGGGHSRLMYGSPRVDAKPCKPFLSRMEAPRVFLSWPQEEEKISHISLIMGASYHDIMVEMSNEHDRENLQINNNVNHLILFSL